VFGVQYTSGRSRGKAIAKATREYMIDDEQAHTEGTKYNYQTLSLLVFILFSACQSNFNSSCRFFI